MMVLKFTCEKRLVTFERGDTKNAWTSPRIPMCREATQGFTLVEVLITTAIAAILVLALTNVVSTTLAATDDSRERNLLAEDARFAMGRMTRAVGRAQWLLVPLVEDPVTANSESIIDPGVLAVTLDPNLDRDLDGIADADNDGDGLVDEDLPADTSNDNMPGIIGIDDDNSGITDVSFAGAGDDDETGFVADEDPINGLDDDGDQHIDGDPPADMNGDGAPGILDFDDDGDGLKDEGNVADDDEDGSVDEDWFDAVVYYLVGSDLIERHPNLNPFDGTDFTERVIAENVQTFRIERLPRGSNRTDLVDISLGLGTEKASVFVQQLVRVGGAL